jgi:hypothetical protein
MSKFKKVSQIEQIPSILENSFFGTPENEDPYAELKANSQDNRTRIAKQTGFNREASFKSNNWEKIQGPSLYNELRDLSFEERVAELEKTAGLSAETIKRSSYAYDDGDNARTLTSGLKAFSSEVFGLGNGYGYFRTQGDISIAQLYNRALTAAEISQNFQSIRGKYGI